MVETIETTLEHARQHQTPVQIVLGGRIEAPVSAIVRHRNGPTFELLVGTMIIRVDISQVMLRVSSAAD